MNISYFKTLSLLAVSVSFFLAVGCSDKMQETNEPLAVWTFDKNGDDLTGAI